jgi:hypothetical protein
MKARKNTNRHIYILILSESEAMAKCKGKCLSIGALALIAMIFVSAFSIHTDATITGAVAGESYKFEQCLKKYGRDIYGKWLYDEIQKCREEVDEMARGKDKAIPRLYLSDDRTEYQNE